MNGAASGRFLDHGPEPVGCDTVLLTAKLVSAALIRGDMTQAAYAFDPYCGAPPAPADLWARWNLDPALLAVLAALAVAWAVREGRRAGGVRQAAAAAGLVVLLIAFVSPLCNLASALFSARVAHHALLVAVAAPLLAIALGRTARAAGPWGWLLLHAVTLWVWHAPGPYAWALGQAGAYWLMQLSLLLPAILFWRAALAAPAPVAFAALTVAMMQMGLLGALITFAPQPLFEPHFATTQAWGLTPLDDQQAAGLIMWVPAAGAYLLPALWTAWVWLGAGQGRPRPA